MILMLNTDDPRDLRALQLAATADQWLELRTGEFAIPSSDGRRRYRVSAETCDCPDSGRGFVCKHRRGVRLYEALREVSQPKTAPVAAQPTTSCRLEGEALWARLRD